MSPSQNHKGRLLFGITGHLDIEDIAGIKDTLETQVELLHDQVQSDYDLEILPAGISALAEGADRIFADVILRMDGELHAVLPLTPDEYEEDFQSEESKSDFQHYLSESVTSTIASNTHNRPRAYQDAGRDIVDYCDIIIAVWDGEDADGLGGTGAIVEYARNIEKPLIWIDKTNPQNVTKERLENLTLNHYQTISDFNSEDVSNSKTTTILNETRSTLKSHLSDSSQLHPVVDEVIGSHGPVHAKADVLATNYQRKYRFTSILVYILAAAAVGTVSYQIIFRAAQHQIVLIEALFMGIILALVVIGHMRSWHSKWLRYRSLAERLRSRIFVGISKGSNSGIKGLSPMEDELTNRWIADILLDCWEEVAPIEGESGIGHEELKSFINDAWLEQQIQYHANKRSTSLRWNWVLTRLGYLLFGATLIAALLHGFEVPRHSNIPITAFASLFLPALGAAVGAIRLMRDYETIIHRSSRLAHNFELRKRDLKRAYSLSEVLDIVDNIENNIEREHLNWKNIYESRPLEPPA